MSWDECRSLACDAEEVSRIPTRCGRSAASHAALSTAAATSIDEVWYAAYSATDAVAKAIFDATDNTGVGARGGDANNRAFAAAFDELSQMAAIVRERIGWKIIEERLILLATDC